MSRPHPRAKPLTRNLFTIPTGAPFLPTLARALLEGALIPGFPSGGPLDLASATVYLPTQRAARAFADELVKASGGTSLILPRIAPLGAFEPTPDLGELEEDSGGLDEVGDLTRRMILARLTSAWGEALKGAIRRVDEGGRLAFDEREPSLVAASPAQALALAGDLAALIDDMIIEGVPWERLDTLVPDAFDRYWRITLDFLKIAGEAWPAWLAEQGLVDRAARAAHAVEAEIAALAGSTARGPTIIAGSTGTNRATARLIGAIAADPRGAVVLPGLDMSLDPLAWEMIGVEDEAGSAAGHPQAALRRLLRQIGADRSEARILGAAPPALDARAAFLSDALRPAESTHLWRGDLEARDTKIVASALDGVSLIVADNEAEEALALAAVLRETLEMPGKTAALITPDAGLARRVVAELARWDVVVENSAGRSLGETNAAVFARLALEAAADFAPLRIAALLAHPLTRLGRSREDFRAAARALELLALRAPVPPRGLDDLDAVFIKTRGRLDDPHVHRALASLGQAGIDAAQALLRDLVDALAPLRSRGRAPLASAIAAHRASLAMLAPRDDLFAAPGGEALEAFFEEWSFASAEAFEVTLSDYSSLCGALLTAARAPREAERHSRLAILGLLEARLLSFDRVVLAGLDETVWPPAASTDAFLNRPMRAALGLSPPERRLGQTAHDFTSALGMNEVVISRASKRGGSPTVPSRFLQRIGALAGDAPMAAAKARGDVYLEWARALDRPVAATPIRRPEPKPSRELRPKQLSVTRIETLRRDPYAIYAERILELAPLDPIGSEIGPIEIGNAWHAVLEGFARQAPEGEALEDARRRLTFLAEEGFAELNADPAFRVLHWPRILTALEVFLGFDAEHRAAASRIGIELVGRLETPLANGEMFTLTARADRIEVLRAGGAVLVDYKTGAPPGPNEVKVGFAPQLTLEGAMLSRGAFKDIGPMEATAAYYLKLGGADGGKEIALNFGDDSFNDVAEQHFEGMKALVEQFSDRETPYLSRPFAKFVGRGDTYDHLARVKEWSATGGAGDEE